MPLSRMQQLAGLPGTGHAHLRADAARSSRRRCAPSSQRARRADVTKSRRPIRTSRCCAQALGPSHLASGLFAAIGALLGFLLAFNAMLLTVPDRRRRSPTCASPAPGARRSSQMVLFQALCLGVAASLVGLRAGYVLSVGRVPSVHGLPGRGLHALGRHRRGARARCCSRVPRRACSRLAWPPPSPLLDLRRGRARDAVYAGRGVPGNALDRGCAAAAVRRPRWACSRCQRSCARWLRRPRSPRPRCWRWPPCWRCRSCSAACCAARRSLSERYSAISILPLALASLRTTTLRSLALAATGAVALFGSVALGGSRAEPAARHRLFAHSYVADADIWVSNPGDNQAVN